MFVNFEITAWLRLHLNFFVIPVHCTSMHIMLVTRLNIKGFQCLSNVVITYVCLCYPTRDTEVITLTDPIKTCFSVLRTDSAVETFIPLRICRRVCSPHSSFLPSHVVRNRDSKRAIPSLDQAIAQKLFSKSKFISQLSLATFSTELPTSLSLLLTKQ